MSPLAHSRLVGLFHHDSDVFFWTNVSPRQCVFLNISEQTCKFMPLKHEVWKPLVAKESWLRQPCVIAGLVCEEALMKQWVACCKVKSG